MEFKIKGPLKDNVYNFSRKIGYHYVGKTQRGEYNLIKPIGGDAFPRFDLYFTLEIAGDIVFRLHLDQKRTIYRGSTAHSGEYDGEILAKEAQRIKELL